jgi:dTDP-4-amino-4,6-dideoxygalactose transaminase
MPQSTLALLGGKPVNDRPIPRYTTIGAEEKSAVLAVLESGELSGFIAYHGPEFWGGKEVQALEAAFKRHFGVKHAVSVNSATSALHCATSAMGIGPGDEVICTPYTMSASATAILMTGAVPVFADIEERTFGLDPRSVEANITPHTRGIMAVNIFGHGARLDELRAIANKHKLFLIEDNAQAPDALYRGRKTGTIGDAGVFSLNRHKTMQSGEGGILITNDDTVAMKAALLRNHGEVCVDGLGVTDIVNTVGLNYRMTEMEAAVARVQFSKLAPLNAHRQRLAKRLSEGLSKLAGFVPPVVEPDCNHVYYLYSLRYDSRATGIPRELFAQAMTAEGFFLRGGYVKPLYLEPLYQQKICFGKGGFPFSANPRNSNLSYAKGICPTVERMHEKEIMQTNLVYPPLDEAFIDRFLEAFDKILANRDALIAHRGNR